MKKVFAIGLFLLGAVVSMAQERRYSLAEVTVKGIKTRPYKSFHFLLDTLRPKSPFQRLSESLSEVSGVQVRNYGLGQLASFSIRGTSSAHTAIIWKGIPIQNPMLGMTDIAQIQGFDRIELQKGGKAQTIANGTFGGLIVLDGHENPVEDAGPHAMLSLQCGSFGSMGIQAAAKVPLGKTSHFQATVWNFAANNNFPFEHEGQSQLRKNAYTATKGIRGEWMARLKPKTEFSASWWSQKNSAEIPGSVFQANSLAKQEDENHRYSIRLFSEKHTFLFESGLGGTIDQLNYNDPQANINSANTAYQWVGWTSFTSKNSTTWDWRLTASGQKQIAVSDNLSGLPALSRGVIGPEIGYRFVTLPLRLSLTAQTEGYHNAHSKKSDKIFLPSIVAQTYGWKWAELSMGIYRKWRIPTLNDLFWMQGGNQHLVPEKSWSAESRIVRKAPIHEGLISKTELSLYHNRIEDYILWLPQGMYWSPHNIGQVWIFGMELGEEFSGKLVGSCRWKAQGQLSYCRSEYKSPRFPGDEAVGKQLIYIPRFQALAKLAIENSNWSSEVSWQHQGLRYTDSGNREWLPAFALWNARITYQLNSLSKTGLSCFVECRNLSNASFSLLQGFPQPGRNFNFGLQVKLK